MVEKAPREREEHMTSQQENSPIDSSIDRRLFLGAAGALTLAAQPALAQGAQTEAKTEAKPDTK